MLDGNARSSLNSLRRAPRVADVSPGRRHPEHSRRMLSASRHPSTTPLLDSASEEYSTAAVPVMTPGLSARDSQDINWARISDRRVAVVERRTRQIDACRVVARAVVEQHDAELVDGAREDVAVLPEREVDVPVVVQIRQVPFQVIPGLRRRVVAERRRCAGLVDRERCQSAVGTESPAVPGSGWRPGFTGRPAWRCGSRLHARSGRSRAWPHRRPACGEASSPAS